MDWDKVAEATDGSSPAELAALVNEAALLAARSGSDAIGWNDVRSALDPASIRRATRTLFDHVLRANRQDQRLVVV